MIYECHGHIVLDGVSYQGAIAHHENGADEAFVRENLKICQDRGITFYRDGGDKFGACILARKIAWEYEIDYRSPCFIIHKNGYYGHMFGRGFDTIAEYRKLVDEARALGADFIKLTASGLLDYKNGGGVTGPKTVPEFPEMVKIAHGEGFAVMVHANGADNIKRAVEAGANSIEHGYYMDREACLMMAQTGTVWVPTIAVVSNLIGTGLFDDEIVQGIFDGHKAAIVEGVALGVTIACGSDAGAVGVLQGQGVIDEDAILRSLGIDAAAGNRKIEEIFKRAG